MCILIFFVKYTSYFYTAYTVIIKYKFEIHKLNILILNTFNDCLL